MQAISNPAKNKRILIATGIYPPAIGGPAEYAKRLEDTWKSQGFIVDVKYFDFEHKLPTGLRHLYFLTRSLLALLRADHIIVLDTFSVALPIAIGCMIFGKGFIVRTGGDFLWESYTERTKQKVLFRDFYKQKRNFNFKEKLILLATKFVLKRSSKIVFSTLWQRDIWVSQYRFDLSKTVVVENFCNPKKIQTKATNRRFVGSTRPLVWKNIDMLEKVFSDFDLIERGAELYTTITKQEEFLAVLRDSYAAILVSLGDISPNMILDAIASGKPFIVTREIGIYDRVKDIGIFVDPFDMEDIKEKVLWLLDEDNYKKQKALVEDYSFSHSWQEIANEILNKQN